MYRLFLALLALAWAGQAFGLPLGSAHALAVDEESGRILFQKNPDRIVPIASLTKLMTAMVVLDAEPGMDEVITIDQQDVDTLRHTSSRLPVGAALPRKTVLMLALVSSDNRAAAALARTYPGGREAFLAAVRAKLRELGMRHTVIEEPTGLSSHNTSTASDLARMAYAAARYQEIARITTNRDGTFELHGRRVRFHNTNRLIGKKGWDILLSKTGFTRDAGRCLVMRLHSGGKNVIVVLLNAKAGAVRTGDATKLRGLIESGKAV
jgi:serine-type D-Ala-D-Ala endopeptidase (penicillin-binding protein 7)